MFWYGFRNPTLSKMELCKGEDTLWNISFRLFHEMRCVNYREMFMIYFLRHFMKYKNSENRFSEFSLSWKTLLLNLFPCLINPFVINGVYKSLKENVSITWKHAKWFSYFEKQSVVQRCYVKMVLKKKTLAQVFFCEFPFYTFYMNFMKSK